MPLNQNRKLKNIMLLSSSFLSASSSFYAYFIQSKFCSGMRAIAHLLWHEAICWHLKKSTLQFKV